MQIITPEHILKYYKNVPVNLHFILTPYKSYLLGALKLLRKLIA